MPKMSNVKTAIGMRIVTLRFQLRRNIYINENRWHTRAAPTITHIRIMPHLITRCLSEDYQTVTNNHDDNDRGHLDISRFGEALHYASYIMPHSSDPDSPHRPAMGVVIPEQAGHTFFYASDYQGSYSLNADNHGNFQVDDIVDLVEGRASIEEIQNKKVSSNKRMDRTIKLILGSVLLVIVYMFTASFRG